MIEALDRVVDRTRVVPAEPSHAPACAAILNDWIDATPWMPRIHAPETAEPFIRDVVFAMRRAWVALDGERPVGFLALDIEGCITALYVAAYARGRSVGRVLLARAKADERILTLWTFVPNEGARRFYAREGFVEVGGSDGDNEEGVPDVLLRWEGELGHATRTATNER